MKKFKNLTTTEKKEAVDILREEFPYFTFNCGANGSVYRTDVGGSDSDFMEVGVHTMVQLIASLKE